MNLSAFSFPNYSVFALFCAVLLSACGGDAGVIREPGDYSYIELQPRQVEERQSVSVSLNVAGLNKIYFLDYHWLVTFQGNEIEFHGQGTETITFLAPEVDAPENIEISATISGLSRKLNGDTETSTSITVVPSIEGRTPLQEANIGKTTRLPRVSSLDLDAYPTGSTWQRTVFENNPENSPVLSNPLSHSAQSIVYLHRTDMASPTPSATPSPSANPVENTYYTLQACGESIEEPLILRYTASHVDCPEATSTTETYYYQYQDSFRVEARCGTILKYAESYTKLSDSIEPSFGDISMNISNRNNLADSSNVCGSVHVYKATDDATQLAIYASQIKTSNMYENERFYTTLSFWGAPSSAGTVLFQEGSNISGVNSIEFNTLALPEISDIQESNLGSITFTPSSASDIHLDFETSITTSDNEDVTIDGLIKLNLNPEPTP